VQPTDHSRLDRRTAVKWMLTAAATAALLPACLPGDGPPASATPAAAEGYGTDPDLVRDYHPGDLWPLTLTDAQRGAAAALCGLIIPADDRSPGAADLQVQDFIDEWISAPYPAHADDRKTVLDGLGWLDAEAQRRFARDFAGLAAGQQAAIGDDICRLPAARPEYADAARFFARYRELTVGGFYSTPEGMKDIGYVGNVPLAAFDGPPREVLEKLGLA